MEDKDRIRIDLIDKNNHTWGNIIYDSNYTLIGMYEDGKIARQLFVIDKTQLKQLINTLQMLIKD